MKTKLFTLLLAVAASIGTMFARTKIGDLYYNLNSTDKTAEVTYEVQDNKYNYNGLTTANIPASVTYSGTTYSVTSIGYQAFNHCTGLKSITIGNSVTSIGGLAFYFCSSLTSVAIPNNVTSIGDQAFYWCTGLTSVTIGNSVTSIGKLAFYKCTGLKSITIPNSVTSIGDQAFNHCTGLTSVTIGNSVTSIGDYAFTNCTSLTSITIGNGVTSIGNYAFRECTALTSVTIPNSVTSIGYNAFYICTGLTSVTIGNSVTSIGGAAFKDCSSLTSVTIEAETPPALGGGAFDHTNDCPIYVPCGTLDAYKTAWGITRITHSPSSACMYTISTTSANPEWGTTAGDKSVIYPENVVISATANYGYHFVKWNDNNTSNPRTISVTKDATYTATFAKNTYSITKIANSTQGSISGVSQAEYLDNVTLTVNPNYGYHFTHWSDGNTKNPRTFVLTQDTTFTAEFEKNSYTISTTSANPEWGTTAGDKSALYLEKVVISATANYGYHFVKWNDNNTSNPRTISVTKDATYTATFAKNTYSITKIANSTQGSISGVSQAEYLDNVTLTVNPNYGYHFTHWSDGNTNNPRTFVLTRDTTFTAEFAIDKSGTCGKNNLLQWTFANDGTLTIGGSGELTENYTFGVEAPNQMQTLIIEKGVTAIGAQAFKGKTTLQKMVIGSNVTAIGNYAFADINNRQLTSLVMPAELRTIGDNAFSGNTYVESIDFNAKLQSIGVYAFKDCYRVSEMTCLAVVTPDVGTNALSSIDANASLCVPAECLRKYKVDPNWGRFDLCELGSTTTTTDTKVVTVEPSDNTALFIWPTENNAGAYTLKISKDGVIFCTLIFDGNGQLIGIAFAPSRDEAAHAPAATTSVAGMSFTVTGLNSASKYAYHLTVADENDKKIQAYSGEFATTGYQGAVNPGGQPEVTPQGIDQTTIEKTPTVTKFIRDGQLFIQRGNELFNAQGARVK